MKSRILGFFRADKTFREAFVATAIAFFFKIGGAGFSFLLGLIVARKFGAQGSGVFALANTIAVMAMTISMFGLDYRSVQAVAANRATHDWGQLRSWIKTVNHLTLTAAVVTGAIMWLFSDRIAVLLGGTRSLGFAIAILGLALPAMTLSKIFSSYLLGSGHPLLANLVDPFLVPVSTVILIACLPIGSVTDIMMLYGVAAYACAVIAVTLWVRQVNRFEKAPAQLIVGDALNKSFPIYLTVLGGFATGWITTLFVGAAGTEAEAGVFRVATQFMTVLSLLGQAVDLGMSPQLSALHATGKLHEIARAGRRIVAIVLLAGGVPSLLLFVFAEWALSLFGPEFVEGALSLRILIAGQIVVFALGPVGSVMVMTGLERLSLLNSLIGTVIVVTASIILIPRYGMNGAAIANVLTASIRLIIATVIVWYYRGLFLPLGLTRGQDNTAAGAIGASPSSTVPHEPRSD
jgi:O-antigen/teichoic acid export membrane protein